MRRRRGTLAFLPVILSIVSMIMAHGGEVKSMERTQTCKMYATECDDETTKNNTREITSIVQEEMKGTEAESEGEAADTSLEMSPGAMKTEYVVDEGELMAEQIVYKIISDDMTDFEKAIAIHDWLTFNVDYDFSYTNYFIEETLKTKSAVCQGYALSFCSMAKYAGLEAEFVGGKAKNAKGEEEPHAWNQVKIEGIWYNVDVTWDDPATPGKEKTDHEKNNYSYFLVSDETLSKDHIPETDTHRCSVDYNRYAVLKEAISLGLREDVILASSSIEVSQEITKSMNENKSEVWLWYYDEKMTKETVFTKMNEILKSLDVYAYTDLAYPPGGGVTRYKIKLIPKTQWDAINVVNNAKEFEEYNRQMIQAGINEYMVRYETNGGEMTYGNSKWTNMQIEYEYNNKKSSCLKVTIK